MGQIPTARTFVAGETETAAFMNSVSAAVGFLLNPPRSKVYPTGSGQSIPNNAYTSIILDTAVYDTDTMHSASATDRLTASTSGLYSIIGQTEFAANGTGLRGLGIVINGSGAQAVGAAFVQVASLGSATNTAIQVCDEVFLNAGDYVSLQAYQNSGAALTLSVGPSFTFLAARWVANS